MRIIHTADWHIGQTLAGHSRDHEHRAVLANVASIAVAREVDAMVIAGDIFDHQNPSGDAQKLFYEAIVALKRARPAMTIVITAGNHDAAGRLEAPQGLLQSMGVFAVGSVRRSSAGIDASRHLIPLTNANGKVAAHVLAVSYPTAACLPVATGGADSGAEDVTRKLYAELMAATEAARGSGPLVVTGHLHVAGGLESEGAERRIFVGGQHAVAPDVFPAEASYVALGHLHKAQSVGKPTIRYSGSLLPLSAAEITYDHGVTLVTIEGSKVDLEHIPVPRPVPFLRLPERGWMRFDEVGDRLGALAISADLAMAQRPFVQLCLAREGLGRGFRAELDAIAERFPVRLLDPARIEPMADHSTTVQIADPLVRLAALRPEDLFTIAFAKSHGFAPAPAHLAAFRTAAAATEQG